MERILEFVEDYLWLLNKDEVYHGLNPTFFSQNLPDSTKIRSFLLKGEKIGDLISCLALSLLQKEEPEENDELLMSLSTCLVHLSSWVRGSKRIFRVSPSLAEMFLATDLPDFYPNEVKFVAESFAVVLDEPIVSSAGKKHDFLVFARDLPTISIRSYSEKFDYYRRLTVGEKGQVEKRMNSGRRDFERFFLPLTKRLELGCHSPGFLYASPVSMPYNQVLEIDDSELSDRSLMFKIVFGLNLYLQTFRGKTDKEVHSKANVPNRTERGRTIVQGADLFELSTSLAFSRHAPSDSDRIGGYEVRPHFRRGHWRRPRGTGQDPDAPKTEWVRPTWIHLDKIAQGVHPLGSLQKTEV